MPLSVFYWIAMWAIVIALVGALGLSFVLMYRASSFTYAFRFNWSYSATLPYVPQITVLIGVDGLFGSPKE